MNYEQSYDDIKRRAHPLSFGAAIVLLIFGVFCGIFLANNPRVIPILGEKYFSDGIKIITLTKKDPGKRGLAAASLLDLDKNLAEISKEVTPAVVNIYTSKTVKQQQFQANPFFREFFGDGGQNSFGIPKEKVETSLGSGVIISVEGYILTNNHVVENADDINVTLIDKREFKATLVGKDSKTDLAILKIDGKSLPVLPLGNSDNIAIGNIVLAVGNPFGVGQTVTMGIISAKGRSNVGISEYEDFIQTDAAINPGNSGGALVNLSGELIGINTAILSGSGGYQGVGFAIPSNMAQNVLESILKNGKVVRGWLGVQIQDVDEKIAKSFKLDGSRGALIAQVMKNSPAEKGGLKRGDIVLEFNGKDIEDVNHLKNFVALIAAGQQVDIKVLRDGKEKTLTVKIGEYPDDGGKGQETAGAQRELKGTALEGAELSDLSQTLRKSLNIPEDVEGAVVTDIEAGSKAQKAGLKKGDVLMEINRARVSGVEEARSLISGNDQLVLYIYRNGAYIYLVVD